MRMQDEYKIMSTKTIKIFLQIIFLCLLSLPRAYALPEDPYSFTSTVDRERFTALITETRCVVCQNQNIADSSAPLANDLREKIYHMITEKKSNEEIKNYLVKRYGEFILLKPRFNQTTFILWMFPFMALCATLFFLWRTTKLRKRS
jgi:cytochrome c-type biogenesis protein CcmH